jgi:hypothetical protein
MKERLDHVTANSSWCDRFQKVDVVVGATLSLDHSPIIVICWVTTTVQDSLGGLGMKNSRKRKRVPHNY